MSAPSARLRHAPTDGHDLLTSASTFPSYHNHPSPSPITKYFKYQSMEGSSSTSYTDLNHILSDPEDEPPLPAPMTTRNRIPRSRATSLARSRGSSRASSVSGSRNGSTIVNMAGGGAGSRPESRVGHPDVAGSSSGSGRGTAGGLHWEPGVDMNALDDELGYVGVGSSFAGSSSNARWETEWEPPAEVPMSSKAKGKKRARSTPEMDDEATARTKARVESPSGEHALSQDTTFQFHDQAFSFHPTTFSFSSQSQADTVPSTQSTLPTDSSGSVMLGSTATMGSSESVVPMADLDLAPLTSTPYPPLSSFDNYEFDFGFSTAPSASGSAPEQNTQMQAGSSTARSGAQAQEGSSSKGKAPQRNYSGGNADSSASATAGQGAQQDSGIAGSSAGQPSSSSGSTPAGSSSSSSSSTVVPLPPRPPRPPTPPPQPDLLSSYTCPICFFPPTNATLTPCGHICCGSCLFTAIRSSQSRNGMGFAHSAYSTNGEALCPVCRASIPGWDGKGGGVIGLRVRSVISI